MTSLPPTPFDVCVVVTTPAAGDEVTGMNCFCALIAVDNALAIVVDVSPLLIGTTNVRPAILKTPLPLAVAGPVNVNVCVCAAPAPGSATPTAYMNGPAPM